MEMHQVRYFLAVARTLNFTRAAEECHVAQPSLTRAIKLLEGELGGDLFRRERPRVMLTPLGERMFPLLKQCYESAQSARALAAMINDGEVGALKLAVSGSIELGLILSHVNELRKSFSEIELKILRGTGPQIVEFLKAGDAELAVGTSIGEAWDRLDSWKLFDESFDMVFSRSHRLGSQETIGLEDLTTERFLLRNHCEKCNELATMLRTKGLPPTLASGPMSALHPIATAKADSRKRSCLLYPRKRTHAVQQRMSALGQKRTSPNSCRPRF